jgi:hypothetical protein
MFFTLSNPERQVVFLIKLHATPTAKQGARPLASIFNGSITRDIMLLPLTLRGLFCKKVIFLTHENTEW